MPEQRAVMIGGDCHINSVLYYVPHLCPITCYLHFCVSSVIFLWAWLLGLSSKWPIVCLIGRWALLARSPILACRW